MEFDQSEVVRRRPSAKLPTYYYHEHFLEMLGFVVEHYAHALRPAQRQLIEDYRSLSLSAQRLYARLVNRKGSVFPRNRLRYPEIGDIHAPLAELDASGWVGAPDVSDVPDLLRCLTRPQLLALLLPDFVGLSRSLKKDEYIAFASENASPAALLARLPADTIVAQRHSKVLLYILFLYFGRLPDGLAQFTMRDLGLVQTQGFRKDYEPRFNELEEAEEHFYFSVRLKCLERTVLPAGLADLSRDSGTWPEPAYPGAAKLRDRLAEQIGRAAEDAGDLAAALAVYARGESPRCTERRARILLASGEREAARTLLEAVISAPRSDEERVFAEDLYRRKFDRKRTSVATDTLRDAETIELDEIHAGAPERGAVAYFQAQGQQAFRVENTLWRTLFGLLFWDQLYPETGAALHSPFEWLPANLSDGSFFIDNQSSIEETLNLLEDKPKLIRHILSASTRHYGRANAVFRWRQTTLDALFALLEHVDPRRLRGALTRLCQDYNRHRHGYPDLLVIDDDGARFVEIKAEGDQLRQNQLVRLQQLRADGLRVDVVRARWTVDPQQTYVVVDVETTGGKGPDHRITELGAVKVRGTDIVDRFNTLLNPQRPIPSGITRLTGISQEMVADAPAFADVADDFEAFMGDAIFVAHNVGFDYRFVSQEFRRLGRSFRHPKLCTCQSMRKLYPGHRSYSLANLCQTFDIPLKQHHRALCDAEAAAELLFLINEARLEQTRERLLTR